MDKKQMAEWLVKNFCDKNKIIYRDSSGRRCTKYFKSTLEAIAFFYSPDGFFAVWIAINKKFPYLEIAFSITAYETICCVFTNHDDEDVDWDDGWIFNQFGKDRHEAFYNAVYEAMNEKSNTNS